MVAQAAAGIQGVTVHDDGTLDLDPSLIDPEAPLGDLDFAGDAYGGLRAFLTAVADRDGPDQGLAHRARSPSASRCTPPASTPTSPSPSPGAAVRRRAAALVDHLLQRVPQAQLVVFVDEPAMASLTEKGFPIGPTEGVDLVSGAMAVIERVAVTGLHCCHPADYRLLLGAGPRILSIPVDGGIERHAGLLGDHLDRGGWVAWGAVPTDGPVGPTVERLWRRLSAVWCDLSADGCDPVLLRTNAMITPVCGLSHHGVTQAEQVMELTGRLASRLQDQATGVRLAAGA